MKDEWNKKLTIYVSHELYQKNLFYQNVLFIKFNFVKFLVINSRKIWIPLNIVLFYLSIIKNNDMLYFITSD
jgi:hypothetical protein